MPTRRHPSPAAVLAADLARRLRKLQQQPQTEAIAAEIAAIKRVLDEVL